MPWLWRELFTMRLRVLSLPGLFMNLHFFQDSATLGGCVHIQHPYAPCNPPGPALGRGVCLLISVQKDVPGCADHFDISRLRA
jgi:hypothetical protein